MIRMLQLGQLRALTGWRGPVAAALVGPGVRIGARQLAYAMLAVLALWPLADTAPARAQSADAQREAGLLARVADLEEQIRRLTGRIEEAEFQNRSLSRRIDQLVADLDARLPPPPGSEGGGQAAAGAGPATIAAPQGPAVPQPPRPPAVADVQQLAPGEQALGTLPRDVVVPQPPDPAAAAAAAPDKLPTPGGDAAKQYDAAEDLLKRGDWPGAQSALQAWLEAYPTHRLAPTAAYWLGETLFVQGDYAGAAAAFARNYGRYGADAPRAPDSLLKAGMALAQLGKTKEACAFFGQLDKQRDRTTSAMRQQLTRERQAANCS